MIDCDSKTNIDRLLYLVVIMPPSACPFAIRCFIKDKNRYSYTRGDGPV